MFFLDFLLDIWKLENFKRFVPRFDLLSVEIPIWSLNIFRRGMIKGQVNDVSVDER